MQQILSEYQHENPCVRGNLYRIMNHGKLAGSSKLIILPVDQGMEHGPDASFGSNPAAYDPLYHVKLAIDSGVNAYAAPLGMIEIAANKYPGVIPMILKINSNNSLKSSDLEPQQAMISDVDDALRLGCVGVGITIYPGSHYSDEMLEQAQFVFSKAKQSGLVCVVWSYPRGSGIYDETAFDTISYAAHIGAMTGAHIIKVKIPSAKVVNTKFLEVYDKLGVDLNALVSRIQHIKRCAFNGRRIILFSGGAHKNTQSILDEVRGIADGGGNGSIIGRNLFQREYSEAIKLVDLMMQSYRT